MSSPFIIWTVYRSGGTNFTTLLIGMSEYKKAQNEPFSWRRDTGLARQFGHVTEAWAKTRDKAALLKSLSDILAERHIIKHCYSMPVFNPEFNLRLMEAAAKTDYRHIRLVRRDEASRLISYFVAQAYGTWRKKSAVEFFAKIGESRHMLAPLPVDKVVAAYKRVRRVTQMICQSMEEFGLPVHEVWHEDIYQSEREARLARMQNLFDFLGFAPEVIERHRARIERAIFRGGQNTASITQLVPNLQEVIEALTAAGCPPPVTDFSTSNPHARALAAPNYESRHEVHQVGFDIHQNGHRMMLGAPARFWDEIGDLQFRFLKARGLQPDHGLVALGCGALAGGVRFIRYLAPGSYYGIDRHIEAIVYNVALELGLDLFREKMPRFAVSESFDSTKFDQKFTYAIAQSGVFSAKEIFTCLTQVYIAGKPGCRFYVTFFESAIGNSVPHARNPLRRDRNDELRMLGSMGGWQLANVAEWDHSSGLRMAEFVRL